MCKSSQHVGIALRINSVSEDEGQLINENGGSAVICVTKRSGSVPGDGLSVGLILTSPAQEPRAGYYNWLVNIMAGLNKRLLKSFVGS